MSKSTSVKRIKIVFLDFDVILLVLTTRPLFIYESCLGSSYMLLSMLMECDKCEWEAMDGMMLILNLSITTMVLMIGERRES